MMILRRIISMTEKKQPTPQEHVDHLVENAKVALHEFFELQLIILCTKWLLPVLQSSRHLRKWL